MAKKYIAVITLVLFLTIGCSKEGGQTGKIGVSAGTEQSSNTEQSSVLSRIKSLVVGRSAKATIHIPATTLISQALLEDGVTRDPGRTISFLLISSKNDPAEWYDRACRAENYSRKASGLPLSQNPFRDGWFQFFAIAMQPSPYWLASVDRYRDAQLRATAVYFSSDIYSRLSKVFEQKVFSDNPSALNSVKSAYSQIGDEELWSAFRAAYEKAQTGNITLNLAGGEGCSFTNGTATFVFDRSGNSAAGASGKVWGTDGWILGQQMSFSLEQSNSATMKRETHDGEKGSISVTGKNTTNVGVQ